MKLLVIRHAQSANNHLVATSGADDGRVPDPDITELGRTQAQALADTISAPDSGYPRITHLYSSLMRRTIQTAAPLAEALDLPIAARVDTHEVPGPYEGPHAERLVHRGSSRSLLGGLTNRVQLPDAATEDGWFTDELEIDDAWVTRAENLLTDLRENHGPDDVVALVTHGMFGGVLLGVAVGAPGSVWFPHENTATSLLSWEAAGEGGDDVVFDEDAGEGVLKIGWANRTDHLSADQRSA